MIRKDNETKSAIDFAKQYKNSLLSESTKKETKECFERAVIEAARQGLELWQVKTALNSVLDTKTVRNVLAPCSNQYLRAIVKNAKKTAVRIVNKYLPASKQSGLFLIDFLVTIGEYIKKKKDGEYALSEENFRNATKNIFVITAKHIHTPVKYNNGVFYIYNTKKFVPITELDLISSLQGCAAALGIAPTYWDNNNFNTKIKGELAVKVHYSFADIAKDGYLRIPMNNGVLCINQQTPEITLTGHSPEYFFPFALNYNYSPEAKAPMFQKFLDQVLPDKTAQMVLQEFYGSCFLWRNVPKIEKILMLYGGGANGKSVFMDVMANVFQDLKSSASIGNVIDDKKYMRAKVVDKLLNQSSEYSTIEDIGAFKAMVSSEKIEVRMIYKEPYIVDRFPKFAIACNELPTYREKNHAIDRRYLIIPFGVTIPEDKQDKSLAIKIIDAELSGVLNWVLEGYRRILQQQGLFTTCESSKQIAERHLTETDSVKYFISENGYLPTEARGQNIQLMQLYRRYIDFCKERGNSFLVTEATFRKRLEVLGFTTKRVGGYRVVYCIIVPPTDQEDENEPMESAKPIEPITAQPVAQPVAQPISSPITINSNSSNTLDYDYNNIKPEDIPPF